MYENNEIFKKYLQNICNKYVILAYADYRSIEWF